MASPAKKAKKSAATTDLCKIYGVNFQPEIEKFWKSCQKKAPLNPLKAIKDWTLVGPFHLLNGQVNFENQVEALMYQRCYHDSPEFLNFAVKNGQDGKVRLAFYRICPEEPPVIVRIDRSIDGDSKDASSEILPKYSHICDGGDIDQCFQMAAKHLSTKTPWAKQISKTDEIHGKTTVCDTITGLGIYVPMKGEVGYRDLQITDKKLVKNLRAIHFAEDDTKRKEKFKTLLEINNNIQYANDECDFGMGYELGFDLFHFGSKYTQKFCLRSLPLAYSLLGWSQFKQVLEEHMKGRRDETKEASFFKV